MRQAEGELRLRKLDCAGWDWNSSWIAMHCWPKRRCVTQAKCQRMTAEEARQREVRRLSSMQRWEQVAELGWTGVRR